jgi:hypothetical protein
MARIQLYFKVSISLALIFGSLLVPSALLFPALAKGAAAPKQEVQSVANLQKGAGLSLSLEGTRENLAVGTSFGLTGTITNNTTSPVYVNERHLLLKVPAEIEGPRTSLSAVWWAFLPSADHGPNGNEKLYNATEMLRPNQSVPVFFLVNVKEVWPGTDELATSRPSLIGALGDVYQQLSVEAYFLFFVPGNYRLTVTAAYWDNAELRGDPNIVSETRTVEVSAPESVILFGAAIGGLISFIILPQARTRLSAARGLRKGFSAIAGAVGAMLLSAVVTILLARVSESQFLIRVTVSDIWGAIAIGLLANYLGVEVINKIARVPSGEETPPVGTPKEGKREVPPKEERAPVVAT